jgi:hypothetical protein
MLPPAPAAGLPKPFAPTNAVSDAALARATEALRGVDTTGWPTL